jgi:hypothetical protein
METNKIRMDYIESELAKRYRQGLPGDTPGLDAIDRRAVDSTLPTSELPQREPAALGKLHEIDLGQEARLRNIARTEEATRRLNGDDDELSTSRSPSKPPRYRKRRTSQDIMRDRLVEEVLRESKRKCTLGPINTLWDLLITHYLASGCLRRTRRRGSGSGRLGGR